jgi:phosphate:Na+ symporter
LLHTFFNVIGVIWAAPLLALIIRGISNITETAYGHSPSESAETIPLALAMLHTGFNTVNTLLLMGFIRPLARLTLWVIPPRGKKKERSQLRFFNIRSYTLAEISLLQAKNEVSIIGKQATEMFRLIPQILICMEEEQFHSLIKKMKKLEKKMDRSKAEMTDYLVKLAEGNLSEAGSGEVQAILRVIDELEGIGDACYKMTSILEHKHTDKIYFIQEVRDQLQEVFLQVKRSLEVMNLNLGKDFQEIDLKEAKAIETKVHEIRDRLRQDQLKSVREGKYNYQTGMVFSELLTQAEKISDLAVNVSEALYHAKE